MVTRRTPLHPSSAGSSPRPWMTSERARNRSRSIRASCSPCSSLTTSSRTEKARAALPTEVPFRDAVANLGHVGLLIAGLADGKRLHGFAGDDRLHQHARASLFPAAEALLLSMRKAGATIACWSGAGPSLLAICKNEEIATHVASTGEKAMHELDVPGRSLVLHADTKGLVTT